MKDRINVAELIKDCPKGMELDCTIFEGVVFHDVVDRHFPIRVRREQGGLILLTANGCIKDKIDAKCVIFPKGKTTWKGFHRPFKDGDIIADEHGNIAIYKGEMRHNKKLADYYCGYRNADGKFLVKKDIEGHFGHIEEKHLATEEEKDKLFQAIKDNGYKWNEEIKTLEKFIEPKFKVGDRIKLNNCSSIYTITDLLKDKYRATVHSYDLYEIEFERQDAYKLVPNKFDITTLKPFDKVLVRDFDNTPWEIEWFSRLLDGKLFKCVDLSYVQCIPYEGNEHLLGKKDDCNKYFKTWE